MKIDPSGFEPAYMGSVGPDEARVNFDLDAAEMAELSVYLGHPITENLEAAAANFELPALNIGSGIMIDPTVNINAYSMAWGSLGGVHDASLNIPDDEGSAVAHNLDDMAVYDGINWSISQ
jgi:hypothetical protein